MNDNEFDRTARLWLDDGPTRSPDRLLQSALDEIHVTRQRRSWWPTWRIFDMSAMRLAIGGAAVLAAVALAIAILPAGSGGFAGFGGPAVTPTPMPTPTPVPTPGPTPIALPADGSMATAMVPGAFSVGDPFPIPITVDLPAGWVGNIGGPYAVFFNDPSSGLEVDATLSQALYDDPCTGVVNASKQPGSSVADLVTALAALPGIETGAPAPIAIDGYQGQQLTLTAPADGSACRGSALVHLWRLPLGADFTLAPGHRIVVRVLDVDGQRLVITSGTTQTASAQADADAQGVVDSIRMRPTN